MLLRTLNIVISEETYTHKLACVRVLIKSNPSNIQASNVNLSTQNLHIVSYNHSAQRIQLNGKIYKQERSPHLSTIMRLAT